MLQVLILFPRLRPLVAAMGWDLLSGKTTARRKLMQLLWTSSKSQVVRLEESSLYGNQLNEVIASFIYLYLSWHNAFVYLKDRLNM